MDLSLPGTLPREIVEAALPLEYADLPDVGLLVSVCPGCPPEGVSYKPHRLRVKILSEDTVDVFCPHGCDPVLLPAAITDMGREALEKEQCDE